MKCLYHESLSAEKKVKFSDLQNDLMSQFPNTSWNYRAVSETVQAAFPQSVSKMHGKAHHRYIHGIDVNKPSTSSADSLEKEELQAYRRLRLLSACTYKSQR